ncbi:MAG: HEAT repeat domain-containing protein [Akkermansiaceae bacterium]
MNWYLFPGCNHLSLTVCLASALSVSADPALDDALKQVSQNCPQSYPEKVIALPESTEVTKMKSAELLKLLSNWNPAVRSSAASALGSRGESVDSQLRQGTQSDNWMVRAGTTSALTARLKKKLDDWKKIHPEIKNYREAHARIKENAKLEKVFVKLAKDPQLEVRAQALKGLSLLAPQIPEAIQAVLHLCTDADPYVAQDAMMILHKQFSGSALKQEGVVDVLKKALKSPLPRGRGSVVNLITRMNEKDQRKFIPDLLAHLDWTPNRDTMFGAGGQVEAVKILHKLRVKELIPRIPKLMNKVVRGTSLVEPCLEAAKSFGKDAKVILPQLTELVLIMKPTERELNGNRGADVKRRYDLLIETVKFLQSA